MNISEIIKNMYLCWKYPFLYPRNRFSGKYRANKLNKYIWKARSKAFITFNIGVHHLKPGEKIYHWDTYEDAITLLRKYNIHYSLSGRNKLILWDTDFHYRYDINLGFDTSKFTFFNVGLRTYYSGNQHIGITIYVTKNQEDDKTYGWQFHEQDFPINKYALKAYHFISWLDKKVVDPICGLFPTWNELEAMPEGWKKAFGLKMCEEIKQALLKQGGRKLLHSYRIMQIKEKWGELCWYDAHSIKEVHDIISKYENISYHTCISCGKPAKYLTRGWICPYCEDCAPMHEPLTEIKNEEFN